MEHTYTVCRQCHTSYRFVMVSEHGHAYCVNCLSQPEGAVEVELWLKYLDQQTSDQRHKERWGCTKEERRNYGTRD